MPGHGPGGEFGRGEGPSAAPAQPFQHGLGGEGGQEHGLVGVGNLVEIVGIAGGDGCGLVFKKGEILRKVPEDKLVDALLEEVEKL